MIISELHRIATEAAGVATEPDSMTRAAELMDLIKSPTAVATGVLIVIARAELQKNAGDLRKKNSRNAFLASILALVLTGAVVAVMTPLFYRVVFLDSGGIETRLLVYVMTFVVAVCTAIYVGTVVKDSATDWTRAEK